MRSLSLSAAVAAGLMGLTSMASAAVYNGNGGTGFGGPVGNGALTVTDGGTTINFSFAPGATFNGNDLVLYLDTVTGGVTDTSTLTDNADGGRTAVSGLSGSGRTLLTFAPGFTADYAISFEPPGGGNFAGLFNLSTPANFGFVAGGGLSGTSAGPLTFSFNKSDLGLPASGGSFSFEGTLISTSGYRANETIGTSLTTPDPTNLGTAPNAGFTGTQVFATANTFAVPEPASLGVLALSSLASLRRRRA